MNVDPKARDEIFIQAASVNVLLKMVGRLLTINRFTLLKPCNHLSTISLVVLHNKSKQIV